MAGRGRGATLPAWMTNPEYNVNAAGNGQQQQPQQQQQQEAYKFEDAQPQWNSQPAAGRGREDIRNVERNVDRGDRSRATDITRRDDRGSVRDDRRGYGRDERRSDRVDDRRSDRVDDRSKRRSTSRDRKRDRLVFFSVTLPTFIIFRFLLC
jgi:hypothetical protein